VTGARGHVEALLGALPAHCTLVTVTDGHPTTLSWLGAVAGHHTLPLGVEHFGQTGTVADLYRHFGIDSEGIVRAVAGLTLGRQVSDLLMGVW
jgi:pyruvate dehydrogenase E1 component